MYRAPPTLPKSLWGRTPSLFPFPLRAAPCKPDCEKQPSWNPIHQLDAEDQESWTKCLYWVPASSNLQVQSPMNKQKVKWTLWRLHAGNVRAKLICMGDDSEVCTQNFRNPLADGLEATVCRCLRSIRVARLFICQQNELIWNQTLMHNCIFVTNPFSIKNTRQNRCYGWTKWGWLVLNIFKYTICDTCRKHMICMYIIQTCLTY